MCFCSSRIAVLRRRTRTRTRSDRELLSPCEIKPRIGMELQGARGEWGGEQQELVTENDEMIFWLDMSYTFTCAGVNIIKLTPLRVCDWWLLRVNNNLWLIYSWVLRRGGDCGLLVVYKVVYFISHHSLWYNQPSTWLDLTSQRRRATGD